MDRISCCVVKFLHESHHCFYLRSSTNWHPHVAPWRALPPPGQFRKEIIVWLWQRAFLDAYSQVSRAFGGNGVEG